MSTWIKYTEKFMIIPSTGKIISKPFGYWTEEHQTIAQVYYQKKKKRCLWIHVDLLYMYI